MYDKDEINSVAVLYSVEPDEQHFELLLKVLMPMIDYILVRQPDFQEHWEDIKQEVLIKIWEIFAGSEKLKKIFKSNIPSDYFYFRIRDWIDRESGKLVDMYDMYNPLIKSYDDMTWREKNMLNAELEDELWDN